MRLPVYFDNNATTPVDRRVVDAMLPYFTEHYGNASSRTHAFGWDADAAVAAARSEIAALIHAKPDEIVFTSGATESNNLAIKGVTRALKGRSAHIITVSTEHSSVLDACHALEREGVSVTILPVDRTGIVLPEKVEDAITPQTILVSVMFANNEIGTLQPIESIGRLCEARGILFHTDATQAAAYIPIDVRQSKPALLSFSAHKMYGPKGIGALYIRSTPSVALTPLLDGGGHERGYRSGTLNVPAIVGFGKAAAIVRNEIDDDVRRIRQLSRRFAEGLSERIPVLRMNGHPEQRLPNTLNVTIPGISAETLMMDMRDIALSSGAACSSSTQGPSHVLAALGFDEADAGSTIRIGLGRFTTEEEIEYGIQRISSAVRRLVSLQQRTRKSQTIESVES